MHSYGVSKIWVKQESKTLMRQTYPQRFWPNTPLFQSVAGTWCDNQSKSLLDLVWRAIDNLNTDVYSKLHGSPMDEAKEETYNYLLVLEIDKLKSGDEPFGVVHQPPEQTQRKTKNAQSPTPDLGFVWYGNPRCVWPIEGKVLRADDDLSAYEGEVKKNFLTGRYATFSVEGAMVGYLLSGDANAAFKQLGRRLRKRLGSHPSFADRNHRITRHDRRGIADRVREVFVCHHLIVVVL